MSKTEKEKEKGLTTYEMINVFWDKSFATQELSGINNILFRINIWIQKYNLQSPLSWLCYSMLGRCRHLKPEEK